MRTLGFCLGCTFAGAVVIDSECRTSPSGMFLGIIMTLSMAFIVCDIFSERGGK